MSQVRLCLACAQRTDCANYGGCCHCRAQKESSPSLDRQSSDCRRALRARRESGFLSCSNFERISFGQFAFVPYTRSLERLDGGRFVEVNHRVELFGQAGVKIMTEALRFRSVTHPDTALQPRAVKRAHYFSADI